MEFASPCGRPTKAKRKQHFDGTENAKAPHQGWQHPSVD